MTAIDVLVVKFASPAYIAVIECDPTASTLVAKVATPEALIATVPRTVAPSLNVTLPVAVFAPKTFGETVAVNVTDCPALAGLADEVNAVVVVVATPLMV